MYFLRYDNVRLDQNGYEIHMLDDKQLPELKINKYNLARANGQKVTGMNYGGKQITVKGRIYAADSTDLNNKLDTLKMLLVRINKNLDFEVNGEIRRYTASVESFKHTINGYGCEFTIVFTCDAYGVSVNTTPLTLTSPIVNNLVLDVNNFGGTANARPTFDFTVTNCLPYWKAAYIDISNTVLGKKIRFNRQWTWGERVVIDGQAGTVKYYPATRTTIDSCDSTTGWTATHTLSLDTTNQLEGSGALKVVMGITTSTPTDFIRLNSSTLIDASSNAGKILIPVFLPTPTAGTLNYIDLYLGSDATIIGNYVDYRIYNQYDGTAFQYNTWNYLLVDLSSIPISTSGSPVRNAIKSLRLAFTATTTMRLDGILLDWFVIIKPGVTLQPLDYEGIIPEWEPGLGTIKINDEFTKRSITQNGGNYIKRYL